MVGLRTCAFRTLLTVFAAGLPLAAAAQESQQTPVTVLVVYHSLTGNTEKMAGAVAEGVRSVPGAKAVLKKAGDVTAEDLETADGIVLGSPTYWGNMAGTMKTFIDDWWLKYKVSLVDKVGASFASGGGESAGKENVLYSLNIAMLNGGMLIAGPVVGGLGGAGVAALDPVADQALDACRELGKRIADVARRMKAGSGRVFD